MSHYVLVHGAWHGAWCWERIVPDLVAAGHSVTALDLPGHGDDRAPLAGLTLDAYVDTVAAALDDATEPVILVGHSLGGITITRTAERRPERLAALVYVTAYLPRAGESARSLQAEVRNDSLVDNRVTSKDGLSYWLRPDSLGQLLYGECAPADADAAARRLVPEPTAIATTPVKTSAARFGRVPRMYVECLRDRTIPIALQRLMTTRLPCRPVTSIDTDHSPFYSRPEALIDSLLSI